MTANHRIGRIEIFHYGLQLAFVLFGRFATEGPRGYPGDLLGLADGPILIRKSFGEFIHRGPTMEEAEAWLKPAPPKPTGMSVN
jgi:hypothetical protein